VSTAPPLAPPAARAGGLLTIDPGELATHFGRAPFRVRHRLAGHPLFALPRLLELARALPAEQVEHNAGNVPVSLRPELTPRTELSAEETVRRIEECQAWLVLKNVEADPEYRALLAECLAEVEGLGHPDATQIDHREAFVFLSSPGSVTPYHIDPEWNFLLQVRGRKCITVFPPDDRALLTEEELERFYAGAHRNLVFKEGLRALGRPFDLGPGEGAHVPVTAPHWVQNGPEVSVSFSITFQTRRSERRGALYRVNHWLRRRGLRPRPVGTSPWRDALKWAAFRAVRRTARLLGR
jgi:hypothetical protein